MKTRIWYPLILVLAILAGANAVVYASYPLTLSVDRVPRESWTYDALAMLAARGLVPGRDSRFFYGDWQYDRMEMAGFVVSAVREIGTYPDALSTNRALLARLVNEFYPEIQKIGLTKAQIDSALPGADRKHLLALPISMRDWGVDQEDDRFNLFADRETLIWNNKTKAPMLVLSVSNERKEFRADPEDFHYLQEATVSGEWYEWKYLLGQKYLWWGPGYSGSMILSDNAPSFTIFDVSKDFSLGKMIGRLKFDMVYGTFEDTGDRFYFAGRRAEKTFSDRWSLGVSETAKMGVRPNPLILVVPSLYWYQRMFLEDDAEFNSFLGFDVTYHFEKNAQAYFEYLIDDMGTPGFLQRHDNEQRPNRSGFLTGIYYPFGEKTSLRGELIYTGRDTYLSSRSNFPLMSYTNDGYYIGHEVGPNSLAFYIRGEQKLSSNLDLVVEYLRRNARDADGPNPEDQSSYNAFLSYGFKERYALWLRAQKFLPQPGAPNDAKRTMVGVSYTF